MKKIAIIPIVLLSLYSTVSFSIERTPSSDNVELQKKSKLNEDAEILIDNYSKLVNETFTEEESLKIYSLFEPYLNTTPDWVIKPVNYNAAIDNDSENTNTKFVQYALSIEDRTTFFNLIYYKKEKVIFITVNEILPRSTEEVIEYNDKLINNEKYKTIYDTKNNSMHGKNGYIEFINFEVKNDHGVVINTFGNIIKL